MKKRFTILIAAIAAITLITQSLTTFGQTYEKLTSIANIDESAQYVLGTLESSTYRFHYSGTTNWGYVDTPDNQTPIYYTLTKGSNNASFTASAVIDKTTYYLTVNNSSNAWNMSTTSTSIWIDSNTGNIYNSSSNTTRCLKRNGNLRSYSGNYPIAYFFKVIPPKPVITINAPTGGEFHVMDGSTELKDGDEVESDTDITLSATPNTGYSFTSWSVTESDSGDDVTLNSEITEASNGFSMPEVDVTVNATFTKNNYNVKLDKLDNVVLSGTDGVTPIAEGETVQYQYEKTISLTAGSMGDGNMFAWKVTKTNVSPEEDVTAIVLSNVTATSATLTVPAYPVTVSGSVQEFKYIVTYYVKGSVDKIVNVTPGESITLPTSTTTVSIDGYSLLGWCATSGSTTPLLTGSYTPEENVSLYAVLSVTSDASLTITTATTNYPTSYGSAKTFTEYTLEGKKFKIQQSYINQGKLQWRSGTDNTNGAGTIYNNEDFGRILSVVIVYNGDNNHNFTMKAGTSANPSSGTTITQSYNSTTAIGTFDLSGGNYTHFVMTNGDKAGYLASITINYIATATISTVSEISTSISRSTDIPATECVVIKNGGILTFTGTNKGNASNIIIEDGGQLIHTNSVNATLKKGVSGYGDDPTVKTGWYTIASPANGAKVSLATIGTDYDMFAYDEANHKWLNAKTAANNITMFNQAQGFLYANSANQTLVYAGSMVGTNSTVSMNLSYAATGNSLIGYNLVGNPFSRELTTGQIKVGGSALTTYYVSEGGSNLVSRAIGTYPIKPGQGFFVQATAENQQIVFNPASKDYSYNKPAYISIEAGNSEFTDMAYVQLGEGNTLRKMSINDNTPLVYVMQDGKDYASTTVEAYKASIPVNFKAAKTGIYTINVKTTGVDMDYLHLIDRYTGEDIDLLLESKYSFLASKGDDESRFILVFTANDANINANDDIFAYQNGNNIIISGEGELQIFDVMGRMVSTQNVNGTETINVNTQGVYIFRLVGSEIKTQKIVVR